VTDIHAGIRAALSKLDGTNASVVALTTGYDKNRLEELGGVPENPATAKKSKN